MVWPRCHRPDTASARCDEQRRLCCLDGSGCKALDPAAVSLLEPHGCGLPAHQPTCKLLASAAQQPRRCCRLACREVTLQRATCHAYSGASALCWLLATSAMLACHALQQRLYTTAGGVDHIMFLSLDEGSCLAAAELRAMTLLSHWGRQDAGHRRAPSCPTCHQRCCPDAACVLHHHGHLPSAAGSIRCYKVHKCV